MVTSPLTIFMVDFCKTDSNGLSWGMCVFIVKGGPYKIILGWEVVADLVFS